MLEAPRILFVPVSGAFGMGEYARSLAIAHAVRRQWPQASIHFILSRQAPYAATAPYPATLLDSSPTFHTAAVLKSIQTYRPNIVIFDNAGRTAQLRAAYRAGARIVFISSRARQRRKAFRWRWMRLIDEHWIAYPQFIAGRLNFLERFKLRWLRRPHIRYLDVILSRLAGQKDSFISRMGLNPEAYVLVVPGGGTGHPRATDATAKFLAAANTLADSGVTVFVGPPGSQLPSSQVPISQLPGTQVPGSQLPSAQVPSSQVPGSQLPSSQVPSAQLSSALSARLRCFNALPQADLAELMSGARLVVTNGGSTLLQAIACGRACIAVPIAQDQPQRIQRCVAAEVAIAAKLDASSIVQAAGDLLRDEPARAALARRARALGLADGIEVTLDALGRLMNDLGPA